MKIGKEKKVSPKFLEQKNEMRFGMLMAIISICLLAIVVGVNGYSLRQKQSKYMQREKELQLLIQQEEKRAEELVDLATYTKTKKFAEEVAKDKLGLVYENEIIFKDGN